MLSDWETHPLSEGAVATMSPRHAPEIRFRPDTVSVRRDSDGEAVLVRLTGPRLIRDRAFLGTFDSWEWDRDRDPRVDWVTRLVAKVNSQ